MLQPEFDLVPSRYAQVIIALACVLTVAVVLTLPLAIGWIVALGVAVCLYHAYVWWRQGLLRGPTVMIRIKHINADKWLIQTRRGVREGVVLGDSIVTPFVLILYFKVPQQKRPETCLIFRDSLAVDAYRQLRVRLRMF